MPQKIVIHMVPITQTVLFKNVTGAYKLQQ